MDTLIRGLTTEEISFLRESNCIEQEYSIEALDDAVEAWKYIIRLDYLITLDSILYCHYLLMRRLDSNIAGKIRDCDIWIGGIKKPFVSEALFKEELRSLCREIMVSKIWDNKEEIIKELHIKFEGIHPFADGNGRVGRIIYNANRIMTGLPIHVIHEGKEQMEYYKWFEGVDVAN